MSDLNQHFIRMAGPWEVQLISSGATAPEFSGRINLKSFDLMATKPWDLAEPEFSGLFKVMRRFHCPTGLSAQQRLLFQVECRTNFLPTQVCLNGAPIEVSHEQQNQVQVVSAELTSSSKQIEFDYAIEKGALVGYPIPPFSNAKLAILG